MGRSYARGGGDDGAYARSTWEGSGTANAGWLSSRVCPTRIASFVCAGTFSQERDSVSLLQSSLHRSPSACASLCTGAACIGQVAPVVISCGQSCAATSPGLAKEHTAMGAATSVKHCPRTTNQAESRRVLCIDGGFGISSLRRGSILSRFGLASSWLDDLIRARDTMSESRWPRGRPTGPVCSMDSLQLRPVVVVASIGVITPTSSG